MSSQILRFDPTRTTAIRRKFEADMSARGRALKMAIFNLIEDLDVFGLQKRGPAVFVSPREWQFLSDSQKIENFKEWLKGEVEKGHLAVDSNGKPWTDAYMAEGYVRGLRRAYTQASVDLPEDELPFLNTRKDRFVDDMLQGVSIERLQMLYTRTFDQLKGITADMSAKLSAILSEALVRGNGPKLTAQIIVAEIGNIERKRAFKLARTELIHAFVEAQLDSFEKLNIGVVDVLAEVLTAGDERVCRRCHRLYEKGPYTIAEARGLLPAHPDCRCAWSIATVSRKRQGIRRASRRSSN